jgi:heptaprenyl diphosphate synthase
MKSKKAAGYGLLIALAFILSYIESLFVLPIPIYGIKLGLANIVVLAALYMMGVKEAFTLSLVRIILVGFTFGNLSTIMYSMAGGLLSFGMMTAFKKSKWFGMVGVSVIGGVSHNIGQIIVAVFVVENLTMLYYLPFIIVAGVVSGILIGILGALCVTRLRYIPK